MKLNKEQLPALSDLCRETAVVIFGGLVIGNLLAQNANPVLTVGGLIVYVVLALLSIRFKGNGE
jgi:hypothetical protein